MKKRGVLSWVLVFAGRKKSYYSGSVTLAIFGVAASFVPYLITADIVAHLINGNRNPEYYLHRVLLMGAFWIIRILMHNFSTTLSHVATFTVLGTIREDVCTKLSKIPLGAA